MRSKGNVRPVKVGWCGMGKLGLTCAMVLAGAGHEVTGYDTRDWWLRVLKQETPPPREQGFAVLRDQVADQLKWATSPRGLVGASDVVFVAVQTPHAPEYGGEEPMPATRNDFEYAYLAQAVRDICAAASDLRKKITLVVVSTVLPGTVSRLIRPLLNSHVKLVYSPAFIAMGTTIEDYRNPEFILCGTDDPGNAEALADVFGPVVRPGTEIVKMSIDSAEAAKVFYNVFISMKIVFANMVMEVCHKTGADCDEVTGVLGRATERVISPRYLSGGMGDGGACHPRDLIALSWLAQRLDLSCDLLGQVAQARERQTEWLAREVARYADQAALSVVILGKSYKPESDLTAGSSALLLAHYLEDLQGEVGGLTWQWDPYVDGEQALELQAAVFAVATMHPKFKVLPYPRGSVVIDPFGYIPDRDGVTVVRIGRKH
jgi:UDPglucose 6-dehydrogenase